MPIEDVEFLREKSEKQSYIFLVDSSNRDRLAYPTPSEYVVEFTTPFRNVIGMSVLHASIPRTMYNVDVRNNTLCFIIYEREAVPDAFKDTTAYTTVELSPGDYTIQTLVVELNRILEATPVLASTTADTPKARITAATTTNPPEVQSLLRFTCPYAFAFDMNRSTVAESLGFDLFVNLAESKKGDKERRYDPYVSPDRAFVLSKILQGIRTVLGSTLTETSTVSNITALWNHFVSSFGWTELRSQSGLVYDNIRVGALCDIIMGLLKANYRLYRSVDLPVTTSLGDERTVFDGPRGVVRKVPLDASAWVAQQFTVTTPGFFTKVYAALTTSDGAIKENSIVSWELYTTNATNTAPGIRIPLHPPSSTSETLDGYIPVSFVDGGLSDQDDPVLVSLLPGSYWVVFSGRADADTHIYYNDVPSNMAAGNMLVSTNGGGSWGTKDTADGIHFEACVQMVMQDRYHALTAPGIYSLIGERYVVMRCPEIEANSYRSLAYGSHCLGLAKFQLGVVGYSDTRHDFSSIPSREFHPIGKLSRITLRFETATGQLYDFKGVNHNITFAIHYLEPTQNEHFRPIMNANYVGDITRYALEQQEPDSDDQDYDYNEDTLREYQAEEARHLPENIRRRDLEALYQLERELGDLAHSDEEPA